jgi:hypothetical protein
MSWVQEKKGIGPTREIVEGDNGVKSSPSVSVDWVCGGNSERKRGERKTRR